MSDATTTENAATSPGTRDAVLALDVGGALVKTAVVGPGVVDVQRISTATEDEPWTLERLCGIAHDVASRALVQGRAPRLVTVALPGQVDEYHGAVQYSPNLPWHDVAVADALRHAVDCEVLVRHDVRCGALAEANLGAGVGARTLLYVSIGTRIAAAGAQHGLVVADHAGAGEVGQMRIRSGVGVGHRLEEFASAPAIARRYTEVTGVDAEDVTAEDVHHRLATDPVARQVWDDAVEALADVLDLSMLLFDPKVLVVGGGLVEAGADLVDPLSTALARHLAPRPAPRLRAAAFGADAGWVGAALVGWRRVGWSDASLRASLEGRFSGHQGVPRAAR